MLVEVTDARLHDPVAAHRLRLPAGFGDRGNVGVAARCGRGHADNISGARLYTPARSRVAPPRVGERLPGFSDEFSDGVLGPEWQWVRAPQGDEDHGEF